MARRYGLKGTIDAVVAASLLEPGSGRVVAELPLPFELKTGKRTPTTVVEHNAQVMVDCRLLSPSMHASHPLSCAWHGVCVWRAQVMVYCLLLSELYGTQVIAGLHANDGMRTTAC